LLVKCNAVRYECCNLQRLLFVLVNWCIFAQK
jgi:hypothetical protein